MTWTEPYLAAVLRSISGPKRGDVERELRSSIADAVEERVAAGEDEAAAERAVLEDLGDPAQLAWAYTGRPTYLIGPELFPLYRRYVPRLLAILVPIAGIAMLAVKLAGGGSMSDAISAGISGAISTGINIAFWASLTFVFLEWANPARQARTELVAAASMWTLERLPKVSTGRITVGETAGEIVAVLVTLGIFAFTATLSTTNASGVEVRLLAPTFLTVWLPILLVMIAIRGVDYVRAYMAGRWTRWLATYHALVHIAFGLLAVTLALNGAILNPAFGETIGWPELANGGAPVMLTFAMFTALATAYEIVRIYLRARRAAGFGSLVGASSPST
jgi:hypothetical protein